MVKPMYAIAGPARSGKNYLASLMKEAIGDKKLVQCLALADPLRIDLNKEFPGIAGVDDTAYEAMKNSINGTALRIRMLERSEYFKKLFGPDVFVNTFLSRILPETDVVIITDLGNDYEVQQLNSWCWRQDRSAWLYTIQLERSGYSYTNEVYRTPITNPHWNITFDDIPKMAKILTNWV